MTWQQKGLLAICTERHIYRYWVRKRNQTRDKYSHTKTGYLKLKSISTDILHTLKKKIQTELEMKSAFQDENVILQHAFVKQLQQVYLRGYP